MVFPELPSARELEVTARISQIPKMGAGPGLHRMQFLLARACPLDWLTRVDAIKITGSKGKGTTSAMVAAMLAELGVSTGLFTSPHLTRLSERIQLNGALITEADLSQRAESLLQLRAQYEQAYPADRMAAFEVLTGMALEQFALHQIRGVVLEAGIGGRFDSTRPIPGHTVALTSVELEHVEYLGNTLELIAYDKSEMCPALGCLVVGRIDGEVLRKLRGYCATRLVEVESVAEVASVADVSFANGTMQYDLAYRGTRYGQIRSRMLGEHHAWNAAVAVGVTQRWVERNLPDVTDTDFIRAVTAALEKVSVPGRFQQIAAAPTVVIDVAHTPQSARAVAHTLRAAYPNRSVLLVTGVSADKDMDGILDALVELSDVIVCSRAHHKGASAEAIAAKCESLRPGSVWQVAPAIEAAMDMACERAAREDRVVLVAGGLFLGIEAAVHLRGGDPRALRFL
jgi:dihydrofolate synthase/folylpolyglutamate synthase